MTYARQRAHISIEEERQISHYSLSPLYRDWKRSKLAEKMQREIAWPGKTPELEVLEKKITEYRGISDWAEDEPWSLGESIKPEYGIPADATSVLLELWRYSVEIGYPLTLRHAKWVARLYKAIVTVNNTAKHWRQIQTLFFTALLYADQEQVSQTLKQNRFSTPAEDADLTIPRIETMTLQGFGILPPTYISEIPTNAKRKSKQEQIKRREMRRRTRSLYNMLRSSFNVAVVVDVLHRPRGIDEDESLFDEQLSMRFDDDCRAIERSIGDLSVDQQRAYAILVTYLSKGPKWDDLSAKDYLDIIGEVAELVSQYSELDQILTSVILDRRRVFTPYFEKVGLHPLFDVGAKQRTMRLLEEANPKETQ